MLFGIVVMGALVVPIKFKDEIISLYGCSRSYGQDPTGIRSSKFVEILHRTNGVSSTQRLRAAAAFISRVFSLRKTRLMRSLSLEWTRGSIQACFRNGEVNTCLSRMGGGS